MKANGNNEKKVLIVDDDIDFIEANKAVLEEAGYDVTYALNGEDGLKAALNDRPSLIVLDVMMTTMGEGFDVARELRKNPDTKKIPLIMLTAINQKSGFPWKYNSDETWVPVDIFLEKPVKAGDLLQNVQRLL